VERTGRKREQYQLISLAIRRTARTHREASIVAAEGRLSKSTREISQVLSCDLTLTVATIVILLDLADFVLLACLAGNGEMRGL
jgi:hypothetical protein